MNRKEYTRKYQREHPEVYSRSKKVYLDKLRASAFAALGNKCSRCGFDDARALQIDHINGGGNQEHKRVWRGAFLKLVIKSVASLEKKYQLLCANCNWIKRHERNECNRQYCLDMV